MYHSGRKLDGNRSQNLMRLQKIKVKVRVRERVKVLSLRFKLLMMLVASLFQAQNGVQSVSVWRWIQGILRASMVLVLAQVSLFQGRESCESVLRFPILYAVYAGTTACFVLKAPSLTLYVLALQLVLY